MTRLLLRAGQILEARDGHPAYRVVKPLGEGGFAQTFQAEELTATGRRRHNGTGSVCLKVTTDPHPWHGEAYFGSLTDGMRNIVRLRDSFPYRMRSGMRYVLVLDLMQGGTVGDWLQQHAKPWTTGQVANALRPLARAVGALHASGAMHRDITPANVFIMSRKRLCLGDFGIARHGLNGHGPTADAFAPPLVATSVYVGTRREWLPSDDTYQLGLIGLNLLLGQYVFGPDWRSLRHHVEDPGLRAVLKRATGPRHDRYLSGSALAEDLATVHSS